MKNYGVIFILCLIPLLVFSQDIPTINAEIESLRAKAADRAKAYDKCPRILRLTRLTSTSEENLKYYNYATSELISRINLSNQGLDLSKFKARLAVLIEKNGQVERIEILFLEPEFQKKNVETLIKYGVVKLTEIPYQHECGKVELIFTVNYDLQN